MAAIAWSPLRTLMKLVGAEIVSRAAVDKMLDILEEYAKNLTFCARDIAKHSGRKKISYGDMKLAIELIGFNVDGVTVPSPRRKTAVKMEIITKGVYKIPLGAIQEASEKNNIKVKDALNFLESVLDSCEKYF